MDARLKIFPPDWIIQIQKITPPGKLSSVWKAYLEPKPTTFRINTVKTTEQRVVHFLQKNKIHFEKETLIPLCYYLKDLSQKKIRNLTIYQNGSIYLQNLSSQIPALILNPKPGERVLDLCASPGSKTTQMAAMMTNEGMITALEPDKIRFDRLKHNLEHLGCENVEIVCQRGESFCRHTLEDKNNLLFDKVLVDVPCSGDGTFYVNDKAGFAHWSLDFVHHCAKKQKKLLQSAVSVTRPGGMILYSTCSTAIEENEAVVDQILQDNRNLKLIPINEASSYAKATADKSFVTPQILIPSPYLSNTYRIYPSVKCEGFYVALFHQGN